MERPFQPYYELQSMKPAIKVQVLGKVFTYEPGITSADIIRNEGISDSKHIVAADFAGTLIDLSEPLIDSGTLDFVKVDSSRGLEILRHSAAHIMAQAVKELFPEAKVTIGPAIENGFYYDFDTTRPFTPQDLEKIEDRMREIIKSRLPFRRVMIPKEEAIRFFREEGENYKVEIIHGIDSEDLSLYTQGAFTDLCRGPHVPNTGFVKAFKLTKVAGAYWRGDERNPMLQRIYGICFSTREELDRYLTFVEEASQTGS